MDPSFSAQNEDQRPSRRRRREKAFSTTEVHALASNQFIAGELLSDKESERSDPNIDAKTKAGLHQDNQALKSNKVTFEVPLVFEPSPPGQSDPNSDSEASEPSYVPNIRLAQNARCSLQCYVPPSKPNGRWAGSVAGNTAIEKMVGSSNGSMEVSCKLAPEYRAIGGFEISSKATARPLQAHIGVEHIESNQDRIQVIAKQHSHNALSFHCLTREVRDPWINTSGFSLYTRSRQWSMMFTATSMTTHVIRVGFGLSSAALNVGKLPLSTVQVSLDPKLTSNRRAPVSFQYQPTAGSWQGSLALETAKPVGCALSSAPSAWRVGLHRGAASTIFSKWSIVLAWQRGDFTLRIPIFLGTLTRMTHHQGERDDIGLVAYATPYVVLAIVGLANEMLSKVLWGDTKTGSIPDTQSLPPSEVNRAIKARQDAASQQKLMKRTAESRKATEVEKGGLVVESAVYQLGDVSWDVTVPLQFWVNTETSSISLAAGSKHHLLGFYPLTNKNAKGNQAELNKTKSNVQWWEEYWTPTDRQKSRVKEVHTAEPSLTIEYMYQGNSLDVTFGDTDAISLP